MGPLLINEETKALAQKVIAYSHQPVHWLRTDNDETTAEQFCDIPLGIYCGYVIEQETTGHVYRHLEIAIANAYLSPYLACIIAQELFDFTGWAGGHAEPPENWQCWSRDDPPRLCMAQRLSNLELSKMIFSGETS